MKVLNKRRVIGVFCVLIFMLFFIFSGASQGMQVYEEVDFSSGIVTARKLNVRQGPGLKYKVVTQLKKDEYVRIFAKVGTWYIVQTDKDYIGAVSVDYIKAVYNAQGDETENGGELGEDKVLDDTGQIDNIEQNISNEESSNVDKEISLTDIEKEMFNIINEKRKAEGLTEFLLDEEIQNVARVKAEEMEEDNYFSHTSPKYGGTLDMLNIFGIKYKVAGENIAGNSTVQGAIDAWMSSDSHKVNIMSNGYNYTGIGVANSEKYGKIFVQIFVGK